MAGSKALILVNVELNLAKSSQLWGPTRSFSRSDELMEDLENQLGSSQCEYLTVHISYRHSAFTSAMSATSATATHNDITKSVTRLHTTFTAAINRHNAASLWSPPPAPTPNRLVGIIASH